MYCIGLVVLINPWNLLGIAINMLSDSGVMPCRNPRPPAEGGQVLHDLVKGLTYSGHVEN